MSSTNTTTNDAVQTTPGNTDELIRQLAIIIGVTVSVIFLVALGAFLTCKILQPREKRRAQIRLARQRRTIQARLARAGLGVLTLTSATNTPNTNPSTTPPATSTITDKNRNNDNGSAVVVGDDGMELNDRVARLANEDLEMGLVGLGIRVPETETEPQVVEPTKPMSVAIRDGVSSYRGVTFKSEHLNA